MATEQTSTNSRTIARIAVRSTVWVSLGTYLTQGIGFVSTLVMTRLLSPEVFGFFSMAIFWTTLLNLRPKSGLSYAAIRQPTSDGDLMGTYWILDILGAAGSLALSVAAAFALSRFGYRSEVTLGLVVLMTADGISVIVSPLSMILEKELQVSRLTLVSLLASIVAYGVAIYLAWTGAGIWSLIAVNGVATLIAAGGTYFTCTRRWPVAFKWKWNFNQSLAIKLFKEGLPTGLSLMALNSIVTQFDNFLVGTFVGYATLGFYDRAYRIANWSNLILTLVVSRIGFLTFAKVQNDPPRLTHAVRLTLWILCMLGIPITLILLFGATDIVAILYGAKWSTSAFFLRFLTIYSFVWPFVSLGFWLSVALGHTRATTLLTASQALALVLLATPLTIRLGIMGTLLGVGLTMILAAVLACSYIFRQVSLGLCETIGAPLLAMLAAAATTAITPAVINWVAWPPIIRLLTLSIIATGTFALVVFALQPSATVQRFLYVQALLVTRRVEPGNQG